MKFKNASEVGCSLISIGLILILIFTMLFNAIYITKKVHRIDDKDDRYKKYSSFFEEIKTDKKVQLHYHTVYILRRLTTTCFIVFFNNQHTYQIFGLMITTFVNFIYLWIHKPFKKRIINFLEITNEIILFLALQHILIFSDFYDDYKIKYKVGWSLNLIVLIQLGFNSIMMSIETMYNLTVKTRLMCARIKQKCKQKDLVKKSHYTVEKFQPPTSQDIELEQNDLQKTIEVNKKRGHRKHKSKDVRNYKGSQITAFKSNQTSQQTIFEENINKNQAQIVKREINQEVFQLNSKDLEENKSRKNKTILKIQLKKELNAIDFPEQEFQAKNSRKAHKLANLYNIEKSQSTNNPPLQIHSIRNRVKSFQKNENSDLFEYTQGDEISKDDLKFEDYVGYDFANPNYDRYI